MFITWYLFLEISENKNTDHLTPTIKTMVVQCYEGFIEFDTM